MSPHRDMFIVQCSSIKAIKYIQNFARYNREYYTENYSFVRGGGGGIDVKFYQ